MVVKRRHLSDAEKAEEATKKTKLKTAATATASVKAPRVGGKGLKGKLDAVGKTVGIERAGDRKGEILEEVKESKVIEEVKAEDAELEEQAEDAEIERRDPYLLKERETARGQDEAAKSTWTNKQRVLVFASRGIGATDRHLLDDIRAMLPHHKAEGKWEKSQALEAIVDAADLHNCNSVLFFEARRHTDLYLWMARCPAGPSVKFQVLNVHTLGSINLTGNCLKASRPLLIFDPSFDAAAATAIAAPAANATASAASHLPLLKEMLVQVFGTPRNHPKSQPFHDHMMCFFYHDNKIWFRHYQIFSEKNTNRISDQMLREIGPRFVLEPIRIFDQPFGGKTLWKSESYLTPAALRARARMETGVALKTTQRRKESSRQKLETRNIAPADLPKTQKSPLLSVL